MASFRSSKELRRQSIFAAFSVGLCMFLGKTAPLECCWTIASDPGEPARPAHLNQWVFLGCSVSVWICHGIHAASIRSGLVILALTYVSYSRHVRTPNPAIVSSLLFPTPTTPPEQSTQTSTRHPCGLFPLQKRPHPLIKRRGTQHILPFLQL